MHVVIKTQETRTGVRFRIYKDNKFLFSEIPFNNYFYLKKEDYENDAEEFHQAFGRLYQVEEKGKFVKIIFLNNFMRMKLKEYWEIRCKTFEGDIKANKRFLLDNKISLYNDRIPYTFYDIETDDRLPLQKDDRGQIIATSRILTFSGVDYKNQSFSLYLYDDSDISEKEMLKKILEYFSNYGIISGWNSEKFDMPWIKQRCDYHGIKYTILDYINHLDYMDIYRKYSKKTLKSYSLNNVSNFELKESKIDQEKGKGAIYHSWSW